MALGAAFLIGFLGSFHCVGMCGPLALAVPVPAHTPRWLGQMLYHLGRLTTYSLLGALLGGLGFAFSWAGWQQALSVVLGVGLLLSVFWRWQPKQRGRLLQSVQKALRRMFQRHGRGASYVVGLLNGLLPCGLVYVGLAGAMATYRPGPGALFMLAFGLGTLPLMVALAVVIRRLTPRRRATVRAAVPYLIAGVGVLLILRGFDLGIPYLSPQLPETVQADINTCAPTE